MVAGPVAITLANGLSLNGQAGEDAHPGWLRVNLAAGGVTVNSNAALAGDVLAPAGTVAVNGSLNGYVLADRIVVNSSGRLFRTTP